MTMNALPIAFSFLASATAATTWTEIGPASGLVPEARTNAAAIHDPVANALVVFGGRGAAGALAGIHAFSLDTNTWSDLTPASGPAPAPRFTPNAIYDATRHAMIVWAGQGAGFFDDVWEFDLAARSWRELAPPSGPRPNARYGTAAVFDPAARELVTFAGFTDQGRFDDTWRFGIDGAAWRDVSRAARPQRRCLHTAAFDATTRRMIVYGGQTNGARGDAWSLDLATDEWTEVIPAGAAPAPRWFAAGAYDPRFHRFLAFGGGDQSGALFDTVIALDLLRSAWATVVPAGAGPAAREGSVAILLPGEDRLVVFGGASAGGFESDVWSLDGLSDAFEPDCLAGGVGAAAGAPADVLRIDGSNGGPERQVAAAPGAPVTLSLAASPAGPFAESDYVLWIWRGHATEPFTLANASGRAAVGCLARPLIGASGPLAHLRSSGLPPAAGAGARALGSPPSAPFSRTRPGGVPRAVRLTIQGLVEDDGSASATGFSPTNAIRFEVR